MTQAALYPLSLTVSPVLCYDTDKTDIHPDLVTPIALILLIGSKPHLFHPHPYIESSPLSPRPKIHFSWASSFIVARSNAKSWRFVMIQICV